MSLWSSPVGSSISFGLASVRSVVFASIPSPTRGTIGFGPLKFNAYGLCIALGAIAAVSFSSKRWQSWGGNADDVAAISMFAVPAGVIGARLYHLATDWKTYRGHWGNALRIWDGGLGIWGGIALGTLVGLYVGRKRGCSMLGLLDAAAPALPLAQAIGRWGNWFNIELFGGPTKLPWGLEVPLSKRPSAYPTFLYESLWNLSVVGLVLFVEKRFGKKLPKGRLFAVYVAGYTFGRFWIERIRTDRASKVLGLRINEWTSSILFLAAVAVLFVSVTRKSTVGPASTETSVSGPSGTGEVTVEKETSGESTLAN
jgi:prolipoprotein diacylglyceryl transferase